MRQRRRAPEHEPCRKEEVAVVGLVEVEGDHQRAQQAGSEDDVGVVAPPPRHQQAQDGLRGEHDVGDGADAE